MDVALADVLAVYVGVNSRFYVHHNLKWQRAGQRAYGSGGAYPFTILSCKDGEVCLVGRTRDEWVRLVKAMGEPEWTQQDRYRDLRAMGTSYPDEVDALMAPWLAGKTRDEMPELADQANLTVAAVRRVDEVLDTPRLTARAFFRLSADGLRAPGLPFKVTLERAAEARSIAPSLLAAARGPVAEGANTMGHDLERCERLRKTDRIWRRRKSGHGFCRLGAGSRAGAARRSEPLTRRRGDTLNHGCRRGIFALTAMLTSFFRRHLVSDLHRR